MLRCLNFFRQKAGFNTELTSDKHETRGKRIRLGNRGSMSTQVVVFSVMLFGASGVVLDFGRVYSEHTLMQSFTDQAALAAAAELDFEPDSIDRAVAAVFGANNNAPISKDAAWSTGEGNAFNIEYLIFLDELSSDTGRQTSMGDLANASNIYVAFSNGTGSGDRALASTDAKYVVAVAEERSVRNSLVQLINVVEENNGPEANVVKTIAAAKRKVLNCGTRTNLVMCNPFEGSETGFKTFTADAAGNEGVQFHMIADGTLVNSQRMGVMATPSSNADIMSLCDDYNTLPGANPGMSDAEALIPRQICHLAAAQPANYCVQEEVTIVPASAEVIQTAFSTAFDMWDEPISQIIAPGIPDATKALFQPDIDIAKGRVRQPAAFIANNAGNGIPSSSRRNYSLTLDDYDLSLAACIRQSNPALCQPGLSHVSLPFNYGELISYYVNYWADHNIFVAGGGIPSFDVNTMYRGYALERTEWQYAPFKDFEAPFGQAESLAHQIEDDDGVLQREDGSLLSDTGAPFFVPQQGNFSNYTNASIPLSDQERRRFGVTFVNCGSASTEADANLGQTVSKVDVVGFADMYLLQPPRPVCPGDLNLAPGEVPEDCANSELDMSRLFLEFVQQSATTENVYSVLVR